MLKIKTDQKLKGILLLIPISVLYIFLIGGGLLETLSESFKTLNTQGFITSSIDNYANLIKSEKFMTGFLYSFYLAFIASITATFLGIVIAYFIILSKSTFVKTMTKFVLNTGLILPYLYVIFLTILLLSRTGFISRLLFAIGMIDNFSSFPQLLNTPIGLGIIFVFVFKGTPFITLFVLNIMSKVSTKYKNVSVNLGAGKWNLFWKIYIPICSNSIVWSSTILFAYAFGSFEVPFFLSAFSPNSVSVTTFRLFTATNVGDYYMSMAANVMVFVFGVLLVFLYSYFIRKITRGGRIE